MVRIAGVDLPPNKNLEIGLTYVYGIGHSLSKKIVSQSGLDPRMKVKALTDEQVMKIREILKSYTIEGDLRKEVSQSIKRLSDIGSYRGTRHRKGLPARGQRTKTNARTKRGARKTVGSGRKEEAKT